ncbi:MAG: hypothetical protein Q8N26_24075 [Myxococcales bacterium]|nr:hypothetical protein [Myxococcales bacterium]
MSRLLLLALLVTEPARARNPFGAYALEQPEPLIGRVTERVSAGPSLYLRLENASGLHWVATLPRTASADDHGRVSVFARAERFTSSLLSSTERCPRASTSSRRRTWADEGSLD